MAGLIVLVSERLMEVVRRLLSLSCLPNIRAFCLAGLVLSGVLSAQSAWAQSVLAVLAPGDVLAIPIERGVNPLRLVVEIDGDEIAGPFRIEGDRLLVPLPATLSSGRHDLAVLPLGPDGGDRAEVWLFDIEADGIRPSGLLSIEAGVAATVGGRAEAFATGSLRGDFQTDDGRTRLGFRVSRPESPAVGSDRYELDTFFLEATRVIAGQDVTLRFGDQTLAEDDLLSDGDLRRGLSLTARDPSATRSAGAFILRPSAPDGWDNVAGLEDRDDRIVGFRGGGLFGAAGSFKLDALGYEGRGTELPSGGAGSTRMVGVSGSALTFGDRVEVLAAYGLSEWNDGGGARSGDAVTLGAVWSVLPASESRVLGFGLEARRIEADFYNALNPDLIRGERGLTASLDYNSAFWDVFLEADVATTNVAGDPLDATDRLGRLTFDAIYDPNDFTGGWLNGMKFFVGGEIATTDRRITPLGALPPSDNRFARVSFGAEKFRDNTSWAASLSLEDLRDRTGAGANEQGVFLDALWSRRMGSGSASAAMRLGERRTPAGRFGEADVSIALRRELANPAWSMTVEAGLLDFEDPAGEDGSYAGAELLWEFRENTWAVLSAEYGKGSEAHDLAPGEGWVIGVALRADVDLFRR
jgi:hypothetical protein